MSNFDEALRITLGFEGMLSDDPADPGGRTAYGITQYVYRRFKNDPTADVFTITQDEVREIYRANYWIVAGCEELSRELAIVHFDSAVNSGPGRAAGWLKDATWADVPDTTTAYAYLSMRRAFLTSLNKPMFLRGWLNRVDGVRKAIGL